MGVIVLGLYMFMFGVGIMLSFAILPKKKKRELLEFIEGIGA
jgi:hypothetical protein